MAVANRITFRPLEKTDFDKGYYEVLGQFTRTGKVTKEMFEKRFDEMSKYPMYHPYVAEDRGKILCTATLIIEDKFIHECSRSAHIEDIAVDYAYRGKGIGKKLVNFLKEKAKEAGCYKILMNCKDADRQFYESNKMPMLGYEMRHYFPDQ